MGVQEIERAITELPHDEVDRLDEYRADAWDRQIERDALAGRLDTLGEQADREFEAGPVPPAAGGIVPVAHFTTPQTTPQFWGRYNALPQEARDLADRCFALLQRDPSHPSLRFKKVGRYWSARVGLHCRVLAREREEGLVWIGPHAKYDSLRA